MRSLVILLTGTVAIAAGGILYFVLAGGVDIRVAPDAVKDVADVAVERGLGLTLGSRSVIMVGDIEVKVSAPGYRDLRVAVDGNDRALGVDVALERLPDILNLTVTPEIADGQIFIGESMVATGARAEIELPPGRHRLSVRHPLYRPFERDVEAGGGGGRIDVVAALERAAQRIEIVSTPAGAEIRVDDAGKGTTPAALEIDEGQHEVAVELEGYVTETRFINVARDRPATLAPIVLSRNPGFLRVASEPPGASVLVDGEYRGAAPLSIPVTPGIRHAITASRNGYQSAATETTVASGESRDVVLRLTAITGQVLIESSPSAAVLVDGKSAGATPVEATLSAVPHVIRIERAGYESAEETVTPDPAARKRVQASLVSKIESLIARSAKVITTGGGQKMVMVEPGRLQMGADRSEPGQRANEVKRNVIISRHFYIGTHEVTGTEFAAFRKTTAAGSAIKESREPVVNVSWNEAVEYANWLSARDRLRKVYDVTGPNAAAVDVDANGYRLPTEAEWEWVARYQGGKARTALKFPWGPAMPVPANAGNFADESAVANVRTHIAKYNDGAPSLATVGTFPANELGLFDLGGNAAEWVHDLYELADFNAPPDELDRLGPATGAQRVIRGASWRSATLTELRLTYREAGDGPRDDVGFRLARWLGSRDGD